VDARTIAAFDATIAFAIPDPGGFLAKPSVFSGPEAQRITPPRESLSLLRTGNDLLKPTFSAVERETVT